MTISTTQCIGVALGNGVTSSWNFSFVPDDASVISVIYTDSSGNATTLSSAVYNLVINAVPVNQLWAQGFSITYPLTGSPIASGTSLRIMRTLPLQQLTSLTNAGNFSPEAVEEGLDILQMQIQQVSARTTQFRGTWTTNTAYSYGDIVQDGANGADTLNYYICNLANTSGTWATDLAAGDWVLSVAAVVPATNLPITLSGAVTGTGTTAITTTLASQISNTVLANSAASASAPTAVALTPNTLLGRGSGNLSAISVGYGSAISGTTIASSVTTLTSSLSTNVTLTTAATYYDGPSVAQGTAGTWLVSGTVTLNDTTASANFQAKLWDGTTIIASGESTSQGASSVTSISLSGIISSPVGNTRISCANSSRGTVGKILNNATGLGKDSTLTAIRIM